MTAIENILSTLAVASQTPDAETDRSTLVVLEREITGYVSHQIKALNAELAINATDVGRLLNFKMRNKQPALQTTLQQRISDQLAPYSGENFTKLATISKLVDDLYAVYLAALQSGNSAILKILSQNWLEQYQTFSNQMDLPVLFDLLVEYATDEELRDKAMSIQIAMFAVDNRYNPLDQTGKKYQQVVSESERTAQKKDVFTQALGFAGTTARINLRSTVIRLFNQYAQKSYELWRVVDFYRIENNPPNPLATLAIELEMLSTAEGFERRMGSQTALLSSPEVSALIWWDPLESLEDMPEEIRLKIIKQIDTYLGAPQIVGDLNPAIIQALFTFKRLGMQFSKHVAELQDEARVGFYPITERGEWYKFRANAPMEAALVKLGFTGIFFQFLPNQQLPLKIQFLLGEKQTFTFFADSELRTTSLPESFSSVESQVLQIVFSVLKKIRNRDNYHMVTQQTGSAASAKKSNTVQGTHLRLLPGGAPGRDWQQSDSAINERMRRLYGYSLQELNLHFVLAQVLGESYLADIHQQGLRNLLLRALERKQLLVSGSVAIQLSENARQTHALLTSILDMTIPDDITLLTLVDNPQDSLNAPPYQVILDADVFQDDAVLV